MKKIGFNKVYYKSFKDYYNDQPLNGKIVLDDEEKDASFFNTTFLFKRVEIPTQIPAKIVLKK